MSDTSMTPQEQALADEKMRAEIAKMIAERFKVNAEMFKINAETARINGPEIARLLAETAKINSESRWYPAVVASGATLAIVAIAKLFL